MEISERFPHFIYSKIQTSICPKKYFKQVNPSSRPKAKFQNLQDYGDLGFECEYGSEKMTALKQNRKEEIEEV